MEIVKDTGWVTTSNHRTHSVSTREIRFSENTSAEEISAYVAAYNNSPERRYANSDHMKVAPRFDGQVSRIVIGRREYDSGD